MQGRWITALDRQRSKGQDNNFIKIVKQDKVSHGVIWGKRIVGMGRTGRLP